MLGSSVAKVIGHAAPTLRCSFLKAHNGIFAFYAPISGATGALCCLPSLFANISLPLIG